MRISEMLIAIAQWLENPNNEAILLSEYDEKCLEVVAETCLQAAQVLKLGAASVEIMEPAVDSSITSESINTLAEIATAFDESGDENLKKSASAIDELLLTIAAPPYWAEKFKAAQEKEIDVIKNKYQDPTKDLHENWKVSETLKAIEKSPYSKEYRMMEHSLNTRTCPDHPGAQMARVGEATWQCDLDKKIFNYDQGYETLKGEHVPGGSVAAQTDLSGHNPQSPFDTREVRLTQF